MILPYPKIELVHLHGTVGIARLSLERFLQALLRPLPVQVEGVAGAAKRNGRNDDALAANRQVKVRCEKLNIGRGRRIAEHAVTPSAESTTAATVQVSFFIIG